LLLPRILGEPLFQVFGHSVPVTSVKLVEIRDCGSRRP